MVELNLEVLWHTDETKKLSDLDIDFNIDEVETRVLTFYGISHLSINKFDDEHEFTNIYSLSGVDYLSPFSIDEVREEIAKQLKQQNGTG